jgi:hypothetical protein
MMAQAEVATVDKSDFYPFVPRGLKLAAPPPTSVTIP